MTVKLLCDYAGYAANSLVSFDAGTEAGLIAAKLASSNLAGGVAVLPPVQAPKPGGPVQVLAQSGVPIILLPSGVFNASGQPTLGAALPSTPVGTVLVYLFGGSGLAAGLYQATFSSPTVCQISGNPATSAGAYAGGTSQVTLVTIPIPPSAMGLNGAIRYSPVWTSANNANSKTLVTLFGGNIVQSASSSSSAQYVPLKSHTFNRGSAALQFSIGSGLQTSGSIGTVTTVDTSQATTCGFAAQLSNASDYVILEGYTVELINGGV